jgi:hypothetical protein
MGHVPPLTPHPSFTLVLGFLGVVAVVFFFFALAARYAGTPRVAQGAAGVVLLLLFGNGALALNGHLAFGPMPPPLVRSVMFSVLLVFIFAYSRVGKVVAAGVSLPWLIGYQGFRIAVELLLHRAHNEGLMPVQMSYLGLNFDVLSGLSAVAVAIGVAKGRIPRWGVYVWNTASLMLLLNIVTIAILSMPSPLRVFMNEPANVWVAYWPFVWLPTFLVPAALLGHLLVFRRLSMDGQAEDGQAEDGQAEDVQAGDAQAG